MRRGDKTIPVKSIEKDYVISWILIGIGRSEMQNALSFKGGTALKKFYFRDYRFSEDLDFTLLKKMSAEELEGMLAKVYDLVLELSNIRLVLKNREIHTHSYTFYLNFSGPLGADVSRGEIKIDFTINEKLINRPVIMMLLREYEEYSDIPDNIKLKVYPLEEIFIEKCLSILDPSRNEPRDVYDLWYLCSNADLDIEYLGVSIKEKGRHKSIKSFDILKTLVDKESNYKNLWVKRLNEHMVNLPQFEKVYRELKRNLKALSRGLK